MTVKLLHIVFFVATIVIAEVGATLVYFHHDDFQIENSLEDTSDGEEKDSKEEKEEKRLEDMQLYLNQDISKLESKPILHIQPIYCQINIEVGSPPPKI